MHYIDIILIVVLALFALIGLKRGLIESILSLFGTVASAVIAWFIAKPFAGFVEQIFHVTKYINGYLTKMFIKTSAVFGEAVSEATTGSSVITKNISSTWKQTIFKILVGDNCVIQAGEKPADVFAKIVAPIVLIILSGIVAFILIKLAVFLISKLFDALKRNRAINGLDRVLGFMLGALKGALLICIAMGITIFIPNDKIISQIDKTKLTKVVYTPVTDFIKEHVADKLKDWADKISPNKNKTKTETEETEENSEITETSYKITFSEDSVMYL